MTNLKYLRNGTFYLLNTLITNIVPIISIAIFTRLLSPNDYGLYALSFMYSSILVALCNFGLQIGYERDFFENFEKETKGGLLYTTVFFVLTVKLLLCICIFFFKDFLSNELFGLSNSGYLFLYSFMYLGISGLKNYFMIYFKNCENAKSFFWYSITDIITGLIISFILVYFFKKGVIGLVLGQLIGSFIVFIYLFNAIIKEMKVNFDFLAFHKSFSSSLLLTGKIFFGVLGNNFDKLLLGKLSSLNGLGIYNLGQKIGYVCFTFTNSIHGLYNPQVYKIMFDKGKEGGKIIGPYLTKFFYINIAGAILISLFSEELIIILTPPAYHKASDIATLFAMLYGTYFFGMIPQLIYTKKIKLTSFLSLITTLINFGIVFLSILLWGTIGAAIGALFAGLLMGVINFFISQKYYKVYWEYYKILLFILTLFIPSILLILFRYYNTSYLLIFVFKILVIGIYFRLGIVFNIIPLNILVILKSKLRSSIFRFQEQK
jgi:O-antigen/teichoic acid export membrane protein